MLAIEAAERAGRMLAGAFFALGFIAFAALAALDLALHASLVRVPETNVHLALVGSMTVIALGLVIRGSLPSRATRKEDGHAHR